MASKAFQKDVEPESVAEMIPDPTPTTGVMPPPEFWERLIETLKTNKEADQELAAKLHAEAMRKALRPENDPAPMISIYSHPLGDTAKARTRPTHEYFIGPYPIASPGDYNTVTETEIVLLNRLEPGEFQVTKADGVTVKMSIKRTFESNGTKPLKTTLHMPIGDDDQKQNWPPLIQLLTQLVMGEAPEQSQLRYQQLLADQAAEINRLKAALAASAA